MKLKFISVLIIFLLLPYLFFAQNKKRVELGTLHSKNRLQAVNRIISTITQRDSAFLHVAESKGEGIVWLPFKNLKNGSIEIVMRGQDVLQRSFIGIVFHGLNDSTYDAVYCRPFNFLAKDSVRRIHAIQYISHPVFTWKKLREQRNAVFEKEILNPPDPNEWFTMRIDIDNMTIKAFINNSETASLVVEKLTARVIGRLGVFVGDSSGGDFKRVKIKYRN